MQGKERQSVSVSDECKLVLRAAKGGQSLGHFRKEVLIECVRFLMGTLSYDVDALGDLDTLSCAVEALGEKVARLEKLAGQVAARTG